MLVYVNLIKECKEKDKVIENLKSENDNLKSENDALQHQLYFPVQIVVNLYTLQYNLDV